MINQRDISKSTIPLFAEEPSNEMAHATYEAVGEYDRAKRNALEEIEKMRARLNEAESCLRADADVFGEQWLPQLAGDLTRSIAKYNALRQVVYLITRYFKAYEDAPKLVFPSDPKIATKE